jgi:hypothetical protein
MREYIIILSYTGYSTASFIRTGTYKYSTTHWYGKQANS